MSQLVAECRTFCIGVLGLAQLGTYPLSVGGEMVIGEFEERKISHFVSETLTFSNGGVRYVALRGRAVVSGK